MAFPQAIQPRPYRRSGITNPGYGVFLDRVDLTIDPRGLENCRNVRIDKGALTNELIGWQKFMDHALDGAVTLIDQFVTRGGARTLIFGTESSLYRYDEAAGKPLYLNVQEVTGTASASGTTVTGVGTTWDTVPVGSLWDRKVAAGDMIHFGTAGENDATLTWFEIASVDSDLQLTLTATAGTVPVGPYTIVKSFNGRSDMTWRSEFFYNVQNPLYGSAGEDRWYATNGEEIVQWESSMATIREIGNASDLNFKCRILRRHRNMMLYGDLTEASVRKPNAVRNSEISEPEVTVGGNAAETSVSDAEDVLLQLLPIGDVLVAYCDASTNIMQFVDPPILWVIRTAVPGIGPLAGRLVMDYGDFHEFVSEETGYRFDGVQIVQHAGHIFKEVVRTIDASRAWQGHAHIDEERGEVQWVFPLATDPDPVDGAPTTAYTEHYLETPARGQPTPFTIRDLPSLVTGYFDRQTTLRWNSFGPGDTWDEQNFRFNDRFLTGNYPVNLFGGQDGYVYEMNTSETQDGAAVTSFADFGRVALDAGGLRTTMVHRLEPGFVTREGATGTADLILRGTDRAGGTLVEQFRGPYALDASGKRTVPVRSCARYWQMGIESEGQTWRLIGYALEWREAGNR